MAEVVKIERVIPLADSNPWAIRKMKSVLFKQGQIEPLQVTRIDEHFFLFPNDPWGNEIVFAARELGWDSLLIVEMKRYE